MDIRQDRRGDVTVVAPTGRIDSTTSNALEKALARLLDAGERKLVVDFSGVDYISSAGLRVFLVVAKRLKDAGGTLELAAMAESVRQVFDLAGLLPLFAAAGVVVSAESPGKAHASVIGRPPAGAVAAADQAAAAAGPPLRLRIEAPGGHVTERSFDAASLVFGRSERADVPVSDQSVSRQHARFVRQAGGWAVEDLDRETARCSTTSWCRARFP